MNAKRRFLGFLCAVLAIPLLLLFGGCGGDEPDIVVRDDPLMFSPADRKETKYTIYLITMDLVSNYWQHIDAGCRKAVQEVGGIDYHWTAPPKNKVEDQLECLERAIDADADAILLSASSPTALNGVLERAAEKGITVVYVDNAATYPATATLVTDNEAAGKIAGWTMQKALSEKGISSGTIGLAVGTSQAENAILRDKGFREAFAGSPFTVAPTVAQNGDRKNIENAVKGHPEYVGFFGGNEQTTRAISEEVLKLGRSPVIVGFDTSDFTLSMIQKGIIYATIQQKPEQMGYEGIKIAVDALDGKYTQGSAPIDMGVNVITKEQT